MTEARPADERLAEAARALSRFQHDLSNPVAVIVGNVQLIAELARASGDEMLLESLDDIAEAAERVESQLGRLTAIRKRMEGADADE